MGYLRGAVAHYESCRAVRVRPQIATSPDYRLAPGRKSRPPPALDSRLPASRERREGCECAWLRLTVPLERRVGFRELFVGAAPQIVEACRADP